MTLTLHHKSIDDSTVMIYQYRWGNREYPEFDQDDVWFRWNADLAACFEVKEESNEQSTK